MASDKPVHSARTEKAIQNAILREFGTRNGMRVWRSNCGAAKFAGRLVRFGVPGQADICGIISIHGIGISLWIEVKTSAGRQSRAQAAFQTTIEAHDGLYILARSISDVENAISDYRSRIESLLEQSSKECGLLGMDRTP